MTISTSDTEKKNGNHNEIDFPQKSIKSRIWDLRKLITVEPVVACWILPSLLLFIAMENLSLEKSCSVNLGLNDMICANMINRSINNIDCSISDENTETTTISERPPDSLNPQPQAYDFEIKEEYENIGNQTYVDIDDLLSPYRVVSGLELEQLTLKVCKAETDSQKLISVINGYRAPIANIFPIVIILFAGGWSDKKGIRKPCMLFPLVGEMLGCLSLFISAIFMRQLPMEFGAVLERVVPSMFGGQTLMIMGIYSYLTAVTTEENRTARFGVFAIFFTVIQIIGIPFSGDLFNALGYTKLFFLCLVIYIIGILYCIFGLKEVKIKHESEKDESNDSSRDGEDNLAFDYDSNHHQPTNYNNVNGGISEAVDQEKKKNFFREFFDPTLVIDCISVFIKERENSGRLFLFVLAAAYFIFISPAFGESDYLYTYPRIILNWDGSKYSYFSMYSTIAVLVGTALMTGVFTKFLKISDPMIGIVSSVLSIIAKAVFAFARTSLAFYIAASLDLFLGTKAIAIKSIIARFVPSDELGRVYSILGILDAAVGFIIPPLYSVIYFYTIEHVPGAFYLFGEIFMIPTLILFIFVYIKLRGSTKLENSKSVDNEAGMVEIDLQAQAQDGEKSHQSTYM